MRHSDYKTTLNHDTWLGLSDTAGAINQLSDIGGPQRDELKATGTMDAAPVGDPQQYSQQLGASRHKCVRASATMTTAVRQMTTSIRTGKTRGFAIRRMTVLQYATTPRA